MFESKLNDEEEKAAYAGGLFGAIIVGVSCFVCPPLGATLTATYAVTAAGSGIVNACSSNENVKKFSEGLAIGSIAAAGAGVSYFKHT